MSIYYNSGYVTRDLLYTVISAIGGGRYVLTAVCLSFFVNRITKSVLLYFREIWGTGRFWIREELNLYYY